MTNHPDTGPRRSGLTRLLTLGSLLWLGVLLTVSQAQITLDGSLGPRGPLTGPDYRIGADVGQIRGGNLFHSFGAFNVPTGGSATFTGPPTIANIVGRVTGGQASSIDGMLRSEIIGANLYLLNPSGVLFGPHASLEVSGAFHVSTADYLRFTDGVKFSANLGQESMLTVASPAAFGFLGNNPAAMTIQGSSLKLSEGKTLSVVGGDITIVGSGPLTADSAPTLGAPGGRMQLASVASPGEVGFSRLDLAPDLQVNSFTRLGRLELSQGAFLDVSANGGGSVLLRSDRLQVDGSRIFADNLGPVDGTGLGIDLRVAADVAIANRAVLRADSLGAGRARDLRLTAGSIHSDTAFIGSRGFGSGGGGSLEVNVGTLTLTGGAQLTSTASGPGRSGDLTVVATEAIAISGRDRDNPFSVTELSSRTSGSGDGGRLFIATPLLTMDGGAINTFSPFGSSGNAGSLEVRTGRLTLTGGAQIVSGTGGDLTVVATEAIAISGDDRPLGPDGLSFPSALGGGTSGSGDGGRLFIATPLLTMDGGTIGTGSATGSGSGNAGSLEVRTGRLTLTGGAELSSSAFGPGRGGDMTVLASEAISIAGQDSQGFPSGLFSGTFGSGDAGQLSISAPTLRLEDHGGMAATARGDGRGGTITVGVGTLSLTGGARIDSGTFGGGPGDPWGSPRWMGSRSPVPTVASSVMRRGVDAGGRSTSKLETSTSPRARSSRRPVPAAPPAVTSGSGPAASCSSPRVS